MYELLIELDYMSGPIVKEVFDIQRGKLCTGIEVIDSDEQLEEVNNNIQEQFTALYKFDEKEQAVSFDVEEAKIIKKELQKKIKYLLDYLDRINNGTFSVVDHVTEVVEQW